MIAQETVPVPDIAWSLLSPFLVVAIGGIVLITITSVAPPLRGRGFPAAFTILTAAVAGLLVRWIWNGYEGPELIVADALAIDRFTMWVWGTICVAVLLVAALFDGYLRRERFDGPEWYVLMLMSASGGMLMAAAQDLILTFLGLEILSIAVYVLAALHLRRTDSQEAAFKYFVLGALASALFLYGIALIYGATGSTSLNAIAAARSENALGLNPLEDSSMILAGIALLLIGFAFKISAAPFHMWTPDVYEGSPTPVVAFMASAVKVAGFAGLARVFWDGLGFYHADWRPVISILAVTSLVVGSFLAVAQTNVKRMLAYSSITHAGFMLVAFESLAGGSQGFVATNEGLFRSLGGAEALLFYLLAYTLMTIGSFGVLTVAGRRGDDAHSLDDYRGLSKSQPLLAGLMAVMLFAQAGVPFTSGFLAKFRVIIAAADNGSYVLAGLAMLAAVVAAVLYLRVVVTMYMADTGVAVAHAITEGDTESDTDGDGEAAAGDDAGGVDAEGVPASDGEVRVPRAALAAIVIAVVGTIVLGTLPWVGQDMLRDAAADLVLLR